MESLIVQRLRDAAEDHRVDPGGAPAVTLHLVGGRSLTGSVLAVEDGAAYLDLTAPGGPTAFDLSAADGPTAIDLTSIVAAE